MPVSLNDRILLVVGKGGTGKTTAACAIALAAADRGEAVHLISTDPAHSLADVLEKADGRRDGAPVRCSPNLTTEAFDARAYAQSLFEPARQSLAMLVEQGSWLDSRDAESILDLSLPGVDEVMAALRIAELSEKHTGRIVVDTAPTGHTLRLLDAAAVFGGWIGTLQAMAEKSRAVATAFAGGPVRLPAEAVIEEWQARLHGFERALAGAGFVVVTRDEPVVEAETERLLAELRRRALAYRLTIVTAPAHSQDGRVAVAWLDRPRGCDGLRNWWSALGDAPVAPRPAAVSTARPQSQAVRDWIANAPPLLLFAGKGGVGKTTCAASVALLSAQSSPTRLVSTDPAGSLQDVLGVPVGDTPTELHGVTAVQVDAAADFNRLRAEYREAVDRIFEQFGLGGAAALDQHVLESLWDMAPPGLDEIMAISRLMDAAAPGTRVVADTAPTGHFLSLLAVPGIGLGWTHAFLRMLLKYRAATVLEDASRKILEFSRRLRTFRDALTDPARTGAVLVALNDSVVWNETRRLHESLVLANIPVAALIVNRADAGLARDLPPLNPMPRVIRAPIHAMPAGPDRLLEFVTGWEFLEL